MKKLLCVLLAAMCFVLGLAAGVLLKREPVYVFENYTDDMLTCAMQPVFQSEEPYPLEAQWVAGVLFHTEEMEVTVFVKEGSGVPVTEAFVRSSVKDTEGYTIRAVRESAYTHGEQTQKLLALKQVFLAYDTDAMGAENPWLVCMARLEEDAGCVIYAAIRPDGAAHTAADEVFARQAIREICGEDVIWVDDLEPMDFGGPMQYAQLPASA